MMIRDEIGQEDVGGVAYAIAQRLRRTFRIEWEPWEDESERQEGDVPLYQAAAAEDVDDEELEE